MFVRTEAADAVVNGVEQISRRQISMRGQRLDEPFFSELVALLGLLSAGAILYLQLSAARRFHPTVDPQSVMARLRLGSKPRS